MSVNIFGSSKQVSGGPGQKGQPGIGFKILDNEGNFDIDNKRLANISQPVSDNDAVTKVYVNEALSKQESNIDFIKSTLKRNKARSSRVVSLIQDVSADLDENKSEVDHLKSFCERLDNNLADIKEEYVTQQYYMNSMVANSKILTELEENNNRVHDQLNNLRKRVDVLSELEDKVNSTSERFDEKLNAIYRRMDDIDGTVDDKMELLYAALYKESENITKLALDVFAIKNKLKL